MHVNNHHSASFFLSLFLTRHYETADKSKVGVTALLGKVKDATAANETTQRFFHTEKSFWSCLIRSQMILKRPELKDQPPRDRASPQSFTTCLIPSGSPRSFESCLISVTPAERNTSAAYRDDSHHLLIPLCSLLCGESNLRHHEVIMSPRWASASRTTWSFPVSVVCHIEAPAEGRAGLSSAVRSHEEKTFISLLLLQKSKNHWSVGSNILHCTTLC